MKKVNKNLKRQKIVFILIIVLVVIVVSLTALLLYLNSQNYISFNPKDETSKADNVPTAIVKDANAILLNNVLLGGVKDNSWVSSSTMYEKLKQSTDIEVNMYSDSGLLGTFETSKFKENDGYYYTKTTKYPEPEEYVAVEIKDKLPTYYKLEKIMTDEEDEENIQDALGKYTFLNGSVKIVEAYETYFEDGKLGKIYSVTSNGKNMFGVYSAVVFSSLGENTLIKYSYVKDTELSSGWPVYSIKHVIDLNADNKNELILQETTANAVIYNVIELDENKEFCEVLKVSIDI